VAISGTIAALDLAPQEAIDFLRSKVAVKSDDWTTIWQRLNAKSYTVAGATSDALSADFQQAALKAAETGSTKADFLKDFTSISERHGWQHSGTPGWRSLIIYETNLSMAYAAGRYAQQTEPETLAAFPYWMYVHSGSLHPRHDHKSWDGLVLRADDSWWNTHYPPNGWRCGCWVRVCSARDLQRMGRSGPDKAPKIEYREWVNRKTGDKHQVPKGIDPGFDYNVGAEWKGEAKIPDYATLKPGRPIAAPKAQPKPSLAPPAAANDDPPLIIPPSPGVPGIPIPQSPDSPLLKPLRRPAVASPKAVGQMAEDALAGRAADVYAETIVAKIDDQIGRALETDARDVALTPWRIRKVAGLASDHGGLPSNAHPEVTPKLWSQIGALIRRGRAWTDIATDETPLKWRQVTIHGEIEGRQMMAVVRVATGADGTAKLIVPTYQEVGARRIARLTRGKKMVRDGG